MVKKTASRTGWLRKRLLELDGKSLYRYRITIRKVIEKFAAVNARRKCMKFCVKIGVFYGLPVRCSAVLISLISIRAYSTYVSLPNFHPNKLIKTPFFLFLSK